MVRLEDISETPNKSADLKIMKGTEIILIRLIIAAKDIDNEYYKNYLKAKKAGVNFLAYRCKISSKEILIDKKIKIINE